MKGAAGFLLAAAIGAVVGTIAVQALRRTLQAASEGGLKQGWTDPNFGPFIPGRGFPGGEPLFRDGAPEQLA